MRNPMVLFLGVFFWFNVGLSQEIQGFQGWKSEQMNIARNQAVRAQNQYLLSVRRSDSRRLQTKYRREALYRAQAIEIARDLSLEDYLNQYIMSFPNPKAALIQLSKQMPRHEVYQLLQGLMKPEAAPARAQL